MAKQVRDLFAIVDGKVHWELESTEYHIVWMMQKCLLGSGSYDEKEALFNKLIRGFYDRNGNLIIYTGRDFSPYGSFDAVIDYNDQFMEHPEITTSTVVWGGARFGPNDTMIGRNQIGTIQMVLDLEQ